MNEWNPMMADYNDPYFNRYSQGVGRNLLSGNRTAAHIFVDNFPVEVGEEGLRNIFSDFGFVQSAELKPSNRPDKRHTFGFVVMADPASAAEAISVLNGHRFHFSPFPLRVMPAITNEEKERRKMNKQIERDVMGPYGDSDSFSIPDDARSRRSLEYGHPSLQRSLLGPYNGQDAKIQYGPGWAFGNRGNMSKFGRGRLMGDQYRGSGVPFMGRGQKLLNNASHEPGRGRGLSSLLGARAPPRISQASSCKQCVHCGKEDSANRCSRCKMYYCSLECQREDWPNHKNVCLDVSFHHQQLYGADPLASSTEKRKAAPGAYAGSKSPQKDNISVGKRTQPRRKEESGSKNQSIAKSYGNKFKPNANDQPLEPESFNARNKDNSSQQQNVQLISNGAKNRGDSEQNESDENSRPSKSLDEFRTKDTTDSQKKKLNRGKNQSRDDKQGEKKQGETMKESEAVIADSRTCNGTDDVHKESVKSKEKTKEETRKSEKICEENKPGRSNRVDESGDAPRDLERDALPLNSEVECYVSFYKNPDMFWVIKKENMIPFLEATQVFTEVITDVPKISLDKVKVGDLCCLLYGEEWSRARVKKVQGNSKVTVLFPDYGNIEVVEMSDLRPLAPEMLQLPAQAIYCCLSGVKPKESTWSEKASAAVSEWFGEPLTKEFTVTCCAKEASKFAVEIKCDSGTPNDLKELLLTGNHASMSDTLKADVNQNVKKKRDPVKRFQAQDLHSVGSELSVGDKIKINIIVFKSVENFVGQVLDKMTSLPELEEKLANMKLEKDAPYRPVVGEIVLAKFREDNRWYRSEVTDISDDTFNIIFLDYGNEENVNSNDIRQIQDASILKFPCYAEKFGMRGFDEVLSNKVLDEFATLLEEYTVQTGIWKVVILEKRKSLVLVDFLSDKKKQSLSKALCEKLAPQKDSPKKASNRPTSDVTSSSSKGPVKVVSPDKLRAAENTSFQTSSPIQSESLPDLSTALTKLTIFYVVDVNNFFVGLSDKQESLNNLMLELNTNIDTLVNMEKVQRGSLATVKFEDGLWYRVQVLDVKDDTCSVFFIDYGNTETLKTKSLHVLPDLASTTPAQAIHCSIDVKSGQDNTDVLQQLKYLENCEVHARVLRKVKKVFTLEMCNSDGSLLFHTSKITDVQVKKNSAAATPMLSDIEVKEQTGTDIKVICAYFKDVNEFYCLKVEDIQGVTNLSEELDSYFKTSELEMSQEPVTGGLYACYFENQWYRCVVEEIKGNTVNVKYVDFGNTEKRDKADLKPLDHEFLEQPICVFKCKLHGIQMLDSTMCGKELEDYNHMLLKQLQVNEPRVKIESKEGDTYLISLSISSKNGHKVDIATDLVGVGLAKWMDATKSPQQKPECTGEEDEEEGDEDEDDRMMKELMRQMEMIKLRKKKKTAK